MVEPTRRTIVITGAAGNLGSRLAGHLLGSGHALRLMVHRTPLPERLARAADVEVVRADLAAPDTLAPALAGADIVIHFAGRLFAPRPEGFLPETNTRWFDNLTVAAVGAGVSRLVLVSFPHVEGPTTPGSPATGRLDRTPISLHAATRLAEERLLFERTADTGTTPVVLRLGLVYGKGILMIEAARWLAARRLLAVWREPVWYQLLSTVDFLDATRAALIAPEIEGIYHVGDEVPVTLQDFLDRACDVWRYPRPWRVPFGAVVAAASACEAYAWLFGTRSPLTRDFVRLGRVSHWGDTTRMRRDLLPMMAHPSLASGLGTLS